MGICTSIDTTRVAARSNTSSGRPSTSTSSGRRASTGLDDEGCSRLLDHALEPVAYRRVVLDARRRLPSDRRKRATFATDSSVPDRLPTTRPGADRTRLLRAFDEFVTCHAEKGNNGRAVHEKRVDE